ARVRRRPGHRLYHPRRRVDEGRLRPGWHAGLVLLVLAVDPPQRHGHRRRRRLRLRSLRRRRPLRQPRQPHHPPLPTPFPPPPPPPHPHHPLPPATHSSTPPSPGEKKKPSPAPGEGPRRSPRVGAAEPTPATTAIPARPEEARALSQICAREPPPPRVARL